MEKKKTVVVKKASVIKKAELVKKENQIASSILSIKDIAMHKMAAKYHETAAKLHNKVVKHYEAGNHKKVSANATKAHNFMDLLVKLKEDIKQYASKS